jgi:hypothetical protein
MAETEEKNPNSTEQKAESSPESHPQTSPAPVASATEASAKTSSVKQPAKDITASSADELDERKVKRAFIDKFRRKKNATASPEQTSTPNTTNTTSDIVAEQIYSQIAENKERDYWTLKFRKKHALVVLGFLLVAGWVFMVANLILTQRGISMPWQQVSEPVASDSAQLTVDPQALQKIRIRNIIGDEQGAIALALWLKTNGFEAVEVIEDTESDFKGVAVVVKPGDDTTRKDLETLVSQMYQTSSPSAELTVDSDFSAVILYAPEERAATPSAAQATIN